jgi:hypothetical protein
MIILKCFTIISPLISLIKSDKASALLLIGGIKQQRFKAYSKKLSLIELLGHIILKTLQVS